MDAMRAHSSLENYRAVFHEVPPPVPCSMWRGTPTPWDDATWLFEDDRGAPAL